MLERNSTAWHEALDAFVCARNEQAFAWGVQDCCTFAADWVVLARARDPMAAFRGLTNAKDAARAISGAGDLLAAVTGGMGQEALPGAFAQVGDVVLVRHGERQSMGVCIGALIAVPGDSALAFVSITTAEAAWRV